MQKAQTLSELVAQFEKCTKREKISLYPHPILVAYLLNQLRNQGPHILVSTKKELLLKIKTALLFFEPAQQIFSLPQPSSPYEEVLSFSEQAKHSHLQSLSQAKEASKATIFITHPLSLNERSPSQDIFKKNLLTLKTGEPLPDPPVFTKMGYVHRDHVEQIGEFSMRGAVLDIFSPSSAALRIELMGDTIIQIKTFDTKTQISQKELTEGTILPPTEWHMHAKKEMFQKMQEIIGVKNQNKLLEFPPFQKWKEILFGNNDLSYAYLKSWKPSYFYKSHSTILNYFKNPPLIWQLDETGFLEKILSFKKESLEEEARENPLYPNYKDIYLSKKALKNYREIQFDWFSDSHVSSFSETVSSRSFFKKDNWPEEIKEAKEKGALIFISAGKKQTKEELKSKLEPLGILVKEEDSWEKMKEIQQSGALLIHLIQSFSFENLIWPEAGCFFLKADKMLPTIRRKTHRVSKRNSLSTHFADLKPEDLVVHRQYGIGHFKGLKLLDFGQGAGEFLALKYKGGDFLYVPVYSLHQVQKYSGPPSTSHILLDKLGDKKWLNSKNRVRKRIQDMTLELMQLYSLRFSLEREKFSSPGEDFEKFEEEFTYQETPDQQRAIEDILEDLTQKSHPADRLICGDTGFGKTEVAMRAAFKVIEDGYQVCLMAPTTILSFQHFESFKKRFRNWPVSICLLNRFTSLKSRKKTLKEIKEGQADILIGTHRILSRDIQLKRPGLLIIDEEHLFGVKSKEKIKNWYSKVDTISLSATPIPRSLSMSLSGLRSMSPILTPPLNRKAVKTFIGPFKESLIKKAVYKELKREGQIIFFHNRIADIEEVERKLKTLLPGVRIRKAHGKMQDLQQKIVLDFFQHKFDLLLCTTIVESGMDFSRAGTLFINRAEQFGLSQLHQLRGRVGRSDKQSYCYLLIDPLKPCSNEALERLKIIQENNQPGAGITIAQYDLEMRGGGELMGQEQSGFLQEVGYEMYFELLRENISLLQGETNKVAPEPDIQFKVAAFIPSYYIPHEKARMIFYKRLAVASTESELEQIKTEIEDFAGPLPKEIETLILISHCRLLAKKLHIRELSHLPPFLFINMADSTPLNIEQILKWIEEGQCKWHNKSTLKFPLDSDNPNRALDILKNLTTM